MMSHMDLVGASARLACRNDAETPMKMLTEVGFDDCKTLDLGLGPENFLDDSY